MMIGMIVMTLMTPQNDQTTTFTFTELKEDQYQIVNDGVMGGRSVSEMVLTKQALNFSGSVSLKNNGGFASVRMVWPFTINKDANEFSSLSLQLKGDGLRYQFRLRTNKGFDGVAYSYSFDTIAGQQQTIKIPLHEFIPTYRGRTVSDMPDLRFADVQQMGVLVADKQKGDFSIDLIALSIQ